MHDLAARLHERGDTAEAETWWRRAAEGGHTLAANNLAVLLHQRGDTEQAETCYRRAADAGAPTPSITLRSCCTSAARLGRTDRTVTAGPFKAP
jgi:Flp pilus assembly protein TadD